MKQVKIFLAVGFVLLFIAAGAVGYVWITLQDALQEVPEPDTEQAAPSMFESNETAISDTVPEEGIVVDTSTISADQKAVAEKIGIDLDTFVITAEMVSCAEQKLGSARIEEIMNGSAPTVFESVSLLGCL